MELTKELRIIRWSIIVMLVATPVWLGLDEYFHLPTHEDSAISVLSGFGEITLFDAQNNDSLSNLLYVDYDLNFQVLKPSNDWEIHYIAETLPASEIEFLKTKGLVDGVYLEQDHGKQFMITVFDVPNDFDLGDYIELQITTISEQSSKITIKQIAESNDWAIFALTDDENYGEQLVLFKENRLYMIQYSGELPENISDNQKSEFHSIMDSFEVIR